MIRYLFIFANLGIFAAYVSIALRRVVHMRTLLSQTRWWGIAFFITCGLTHLFMVFMTAFQWHLHDTLPLWFVANHIVQFFAAWFFLQTTQIERDYKKAVKEDPKIDFGIE